MGEEILLGRGINTYRKDDRELLLDIRNGKYTYDEIFKIVDIYENKFQEAYEKTRLPDKPDYDSINKVIMEINNKVLSKDEDRYSRKSKIHN